MLSNISFLNEDVRSLEPISRIRLSVSTLASEVKRTQMVR